MSLNNIYLLFLRCLNLILDRNLWWSSFRLILLFLFLISNFKRNCTGFSLNFFLIQFIVLIYLLVVIARLSWICIFKNSSWGDWFHLLVMYKIYLSCSNFFNNCFLFWNVLRFLFNLLFIFYLCLFIFFFPMMVFI